MDEQQAQAPTQLLDSIANSGVLENLSPPLQTALFLGSLAFLTAILVSVTSFTRIVIVLSFVRRALATQEIPSTPTVIGLSLFLTMFTMGPVIDSISENAVIPYLNKDSDANSDKQVDGVTAVRLITAELHKFMLRHTRERDLALFIQMSQSKTEAVVFPEDPSDTPFRTLVPAFMISELKTAFIMGFCIYIPFILVDLLVSTILMSLGMMMMPPVVVSAPIKLLLFVLVDGWHLISMALGSSFLS